MEVVREVLMDREGVVIINPYRGVMTKAQVNLPDEVHTKNSIVNTLPQGRLFLCGCALIELVDDPDLKLTLLGPYQFARLYNNLQDRDVPTFFIVKGLETLPYPPGPEITVSVRFRDTTSLNIPRASACTEEFHP